MKIDYKKHFIAKNCSIQPFEYRAFGLRYSAAFRLHNGNDIYYIELVPKSCFDLTVANIEVLAELPSCRKCIHKSKTLKGAIEFLEEVAQQRCYWIGNEI